MNSFYQQCDVASHHTATIHTPTVSISLVSHNCQNSVRAKFRLMEMKYGLRKIFSWVKISATLYPMGSLYCCNPWHKSTNHNSRLNCSSLASQPGLKENEYQTFRKSVPSCLLSGPIWTFQQILVLMHLPSFIRRTRVKLCGVELFCFSE